MLQVVEVTQQFPLAQPPQTQQNTQSQGPQPSSQASIPIVQQMPAIHLHFHQPEANTSHPREQTLQTQDPPQWVHWVIKNNMSWSRVVRGYQEAEKKAMLAATRWRKSRSSPDLRLLTEQWEVSLWFFFFKGMQHDQMKTNVRITFWLFLTFTHWENSSLVMGVLFFFDICSSRIAFACWVLVSSWCHGSKGQYHSHSTLATKSE